MLIKPENIEDVRTALQQLGDPSMTIEQLDGIVGGGIDGGTPQEAKIFRNGVELTREEYAEIAPKIDEIFSEFFPPRP
jgi:nitrogen regulatory protein PII